MTKSVVLDSVTGESQDSEVRTSTGTFFNLNVRPCPLVLPSLPSLLKLAAPVAQDGACLRLQSALSLLKFHFAPMLRKLQPCKVEDVAQPGHARQMGVLQHSAK